MAPLFDETTGQYSEGAFGYDTHASLGNESSLFESVGNVITKGIPLTGLSVVNSFANTGIEVANFFGADIEPLKAENELTSLGMNDYADYYTAHSQGIEAAGLLAGSIIPGGAAIKAVKAAQAGRIGSIMARATNLFMPATQEVIAGALADIQAGDAALFGSINANKFQAIALGFRDNAVQSLAYEMATAATMKASPLLDDQSYTDLTYNAFYGMLTGGVIGGGLEAISTRGIINRALVAADKATKPQELTTHLGMSPNATWDGVNIAGDRVALLLDSMDKIPINEGGVLGTKKASATLDNALLDAKKTLQSLVSPGDEDLANSTFDTLWQMKQQGQDKDAMFNYLSRLAKISRMGDEPSIPTGDLFYINRFAKGEVRGLGDVLTSAPTSEAELSLRYQLRPYSTEIKIGKFTDTIEDINGVERPAYSTVKEAFADGNDIFVQENGRVSVNPSAPNLLGRAPREGENRILSIAEEKLFRQTGQLPLGSAPLTGAPLILKVAGEDAGSVMTKAIPVVGDYGGVKIVNQGLLYGGKLSLQTVDDALTSQTPTIDANARYVWARERGLRRGDQIGENDIPLLEQLYKEATDSGNFSDYMKQAERRGIDIEESGLPLSSTDLLNQIRGAKDDLIHDVMQANPKMSSEEIARRANVPESYIANNFRANQPSDYMVDTSTLSKVNHVQLEYNVGNVSVQDGNILRGMLDTQYRVQLIQDVAKTAVVKEFGPDANQILLPKYTSKDANISGVGAGLVTFSNAAYGTLGNAVERVGRFVTRILEQRQGEVARTLTPVANVIRNDERAAAELGNFIAVRRRTSEPYTFISPQLAAKYNLDPNTAVLTRSLIKDKTGAVVDWNKDYLPDGFVAGISKFSKSSDVSDINLGKGLRTFFELNPKVADFERAQQLINDKRVLSRNNWRTAQGLDGSLEVGNLYAPAVDTTKYPHIALVKAKEGTPFSDDGVSVITAETAQDLEQKIASLRTDYSVYTKDMVKKYHEVEGDYQYDRNFQQSQVNSDLRRRGILNDIYPDTRAETILKDYTDFNSRQEIRLVRDYVELGNAQLFAELRAMGERFTAPETSQAKWYSNLFARGADNPYNDYVRTALAVRDTDTYKLWSDAQEKLEAFGSTAFRAARAAFSSAQKGVLSYEEAAKMSESFGIGNPYASATNALHAYYDVANKLPPTRILSKFVNTANLVQSATAIRLDAFQSLINVISSPILTMAEAASVRQLITTTLPDGSGRVIPATTKVIAGAIKNYFNSAEREQWMPIYKQMGIVRDTSSEYFQLVDAMTLPYGRWSDSVINKKLTDMMDLGAKYSGSQYTENFVRYIAADVARQLFSAAGKEGMDLIDNVGTFVNRVHGNYVASQRPIAFQGPIGQAASLFQTYQFNLFQQLFRYVENGEHKTLALLTALQGGIFGAQSLPGINFINTHLVGTAAGNPSHADLYSTGANFFGKDLGDFIMYGAASNIPFAKFGLYGRGDINPRQISVLPLNPLEFPAVSGAINFMSALFETTDKIVKGGAATQSLMLGLEHNGLSRPLSGLAQLMQGFVTTADGKLVSTVRPGLDDNTMGWNDVLNAANFGRLLGARPLDEAVTMDALYRKTLYQAKDNTRIEALGSAAKTYLYGGGEMPDNVVENFASSYASMGGYAPRFGQEMMKWSQDANASVANQIFRQLQKPLNQQMMQIMGGQKLPDYQNLGSTSAASSGVR